MKQKVIGQDLDARISDILQCRRLWAFAGKPTVGRAPVGQARFWPSLAFYSQAHFLFNGWSLLRGKMFSL